ncbi:MAG: CoA transferase [Pseudomonadales bacterium]
MSTADASLVRAALDDLLAIVGLDADDIEIEGEDLALDTRIRATEAAAAALGAGGYVASRFIGDSTVRVATRHVEASLQSYAHLKFEDPDRAPGPRIAAAQSATLSGFQRTGDGRWMYIHPGFAHNTESLLELFGQPRDEDEAKRAIACWEAPELEREIMRRGLCSAMVRGPEEWDASPMGRILNSRPVVEIIQVGDADPRPATSGARPLTDYKVLDLTRVLAGPTCARTLASYGARVIRISAEDLPHVPLFVAETGLGKRSAHIDLKSDSGQAKMRELIGQADVFSQGYRTGALERQGFGVADVVRAKPGIVYVSINCYGHEGPWRNLPGWEQLAQTVTGMAYLHGNYHNDGRPQLQPAAVTDYTTGYLAAYGTLAALLRQREQGGSYWVRVSLARTGVWMRSLGLREAVTYRAFDDDEITSYQAVAQTEWGAMHHLRSAVELSNTDVFWQQPPVSLGSHAPAFTR